MDGEQESSDHKQGESTDTEPFSKVDLPVMNKYPSPKRAKNAFIIYSLEKSPKMRKERPKLTLADCVFIQEELTMQWINMNEDQKKPYMEAV